MKLQNQLQKNIGIIAGAVVVLGVVGVTIFQESDNGGGVANTPVAVTTDSTSNIPAQTINTQPQPTLTNTENETGDDDSGSVSKTTSTPSVPIKPAPVVSTPPATIPKNYTSIYKNGTYSATGSYGSPGGTENISVTLTLSNDIITSVSVTSGAYDRRSQGYQNVFIANYKQYVIGKNIASVNLGKISSSSLTPIGFNNALAQIKSQAKA